MEQAGVVMEMETTEFLISTLCLHQEEYST